MTAQALSALDPADDGSTPGFLVNAGLIDAMDEDGDGPTYRVTRYIIYPTGFSRVHSPERRHWCLRVEDAGDGWAVRWRSLCLNYRNQWEFDPPAKSRTNDFIARCRFSERAAILRAKRIVDALEVDGVTFDGFVERVRQEAAAEARAALASGSSASPLDTNPAGPVLPLHHRLKRALFALPVPGSASGGPADQGE
jgi:hypothetical protein